jgi:hypothetical protein
MRGSGMPVNGLSVPLAGVAVSSFHCRGMHRWASMGIVDNRRPPLVIGGHRRSSAAIVGHRRSSLVNVGPLVIGGHRCTAEAFASRIVWFNHGIKQANASALRCRHVNTAATRPPPSRRHRRIAYAGRRCGDAAMPPR